MAKSWCILGLDVLASWVKLLSRSCWSGYRSCSIEGGHQNGEMCILLHCALLDHKVLREHPDPRYTNFLPSASTYICYNFLIRKHQKQHKTIRCNMFFSGSKTAKRCNLKSLVPNSQESCISTVPNSQQARPPSHLLNEKWISHEQQPHICVQCSFWCKHQSTYRG